MTPGAREIIEGLREEIRRIERRAPRRACFVSSGRKPVDAILPGGGVPRGALTELVGGKASGKTGLALSILATAMGGDGLAAFVDGRGELYPPAAAAFGVSLDRLLVVRPPAPAHEARESEVARHALWAGEALLASGAFEAVAMDVPLMGLRGQALGSAAVKGVLHRLRAAAERGGAVAIWLGRPEEERLPSAVRLELTMGAEGLLIRRAFARGGSEATRPVWRAACPGPAVDGANDAA